MEGLMMSGFFGKLTGMAGWFKGLFIGSDVKPVEDQTKECRVIEHESSKVEVSGDGEFTIRMMGRL